MSENVCRLCFREQISTINIFSAEGIDLHIAEAIRLHLADEVNEDDFLPKLICQICWISLESFDNFFNAVKKAKEDFLTKFLVHKDPISIETVSIDCPQIVWVEDESLMVESSESETAQNCYVEENILPEIDGIVVNSFEHSQCDIDVADTSEGTHTMNITENGSESANDSVSNSLTNASVRKQALGDEFDHLISDYMDMFCEVCNHPFETLKEASSHYLSQHKQRLTTVKCCNVRMILLCEVREHIQFHLNPETYKCHECRKTFMSNQRLRGHLNEGKNTCKNNVLNHSLLRNPNKRGKHKRKNSNKRAQSRKRPIGSRARPELQAVVSIDHDSNENRNNTAWMEAEPSTSAHLIKSEMCPEIFNQYNQEEEALNDIEGVEIDPIENVDAEQIYYVISGNTDVDKDTELQTDSDSPKHIKAVQRQCASNEEFDHLISDYMDMFCEMCNHPFETLKEASKHYYSQHQQRMAPLKCCQVRMILLSEVRAHIRYHLNPDIFKCRECGNVFMSDTRLKVHLYDKNFSCGDNVRHQLSETKRKRRD